MYRSAENLSFIASFQFFFSTGVKPLSHLSTPNHLSPNFFYPFFRSSKSFLNLLKSFFSHVHLAVFLSYLLYFWKSLQLSLTPLTFTQLFRPSSSSFSFSQRCSPYLLYLIQLWHLFSRAKPAFTFSSKLHYFTYQGSSGRKKKFDASDGFDF